jgi:type IV pilus assembly protein PilB
VSEIIQHIETSITQVISADIAFQYRIIPIKKEENTIVFYTDHQHKNELVQELQIILGNNIQLIAIASIKVDELLRTHYRKRETTANATPLNFSEDFLLNIIHEAKETRSSDIHFEAFEKHNRIRFRIDGKLIEKYLISLEEYPKIINRIKILASLDISEKRLPQDGRISISTEKEDFDIRVSSLPTLHGEKLVLRILSKSSLELNLEQLGFSEKELTLYKSAIKKTNGIVLVSGPTGSGKTTTLYATLKILNTDDTNILTIEDPIEYTLEGINQVQLKEDIGLDFSSTLRTFLRQDPDIMMVGEIRDSKTANMAIRAALTGHLVLSTIHTNSAWGTVSRLIDMDIPPFLIASTLNVSVAQRLVRKLCETCKKEVPTEKNDFPTNFESPKNLQTHYKASGCNNCYQTGYKGRKAIYEILPITKELIERIESKELDIHTYLKEQKIATLGENALNLVVNGTTSIEEIYNLLI